MPHSASPSRRRPIWLACTLGAALVALAFPGCGRHSQATTIRVSGAWALYPLMTRWAATYQQTHPGVRIDVSAGGAGKGIADSLSGLVELGMVSRDITPEEVAKGAVALPVARDATLLVMNAGNPSARLLQAKGFSRATSLALWLRETPTRWGQVAGDTNAAKVQVYTRSDSCGAAETWAKYLGGRQQDLNGIGVYGDPGIAEAVRKDSQGVAYCNLNYAYDASTGLPVQGLLVIPIDANDNGHADPAEVLDTKAQAIAAIRSGTYPAPPARDLNLVAKSGLRGPASDFVRWILADGQLLVDGAGYIQISPAQLQDARARLAK